MADQQHTQPRDHVRLQLQGDTERERWLSLKDHGAFCVTAPDDSMAPAVRAGARLDFDARLTPRDGDVALFIDIAGRAFVREYRRQKRGGFVARPINPRYRHSTFHARRDGLVVLAVLTAHTVGSRRTQ
jgi:hypothetical protein